MYCVVEKAEGYKPKTARNTLFFSDFISDLVLNDVSKSLFNLNAYTSL